jgi:hypothetical protein
MVAAARKERFGAEPDRAVDYETALEDEFLL